MTSRREQESGPELVFELKWKRPAKSSVKREDNRASIVNWDTPDNPDTTLNLLSFKSYLCQNLGSSGDVAVSYVDSDGDELPIDSQCEFQEALKFARGRAKKDKNVLLLIDKIDKESSGSEKFNPKDLASNPDSDQLFVFKAKHPSSASKKVMAPISMNGIVERVSEMTLDELNINAPSLPASSETTPPVWFKNYMEMLKSEIVAEVSTKVMTDVMEVLSNHTSESCPSWNRQSERRNRYSYETHCEEKQQRRKKKRVAEAVDSCETLRSPQKQDAKLLREVKKIGKQERKLEKKLDDKLERLEQKTRSILEKKKRCLEVAVIANNLDKGSDHVETDLEKPVVITNVASTPPQNTPNKEICFTAIPADCMKGKIRMSCSVMGHEMFDNPTFKEYERPAVAEVEITPPQNTQNKEIYFASCHREGIQDGVQMSCSIPGFDEMLDNPSFEDFAYYSESDSDNISIISGISNDSDFAHENNLEMVPMPSCFLLDKPVNSCEASNVKNPETLDNSPCITPELSNHNFNFVVCEAESDRNNNRDSPSYELLSEPPSPASSIHVDEDHISTNKKITTATALNSDWIDFNHDVSDSKKGTAYVVDAQGKIFDGNVLNEIDDAIEMNLFKRPGGTYSYINDTLPSHTGMEIPPISKPETKYEQSVEDDCNLNLNMKSSHPSYVTQKEESTTNKSETVSAVNQSAFQSQENLGGMSHESTQSFSSHTSRGPVNSSYTFTHFHNKASYSGPKYTFVDHNVSKGLGETKYTSCEKNCSSRAHEAEKKKERTNGMSGKYQRGFTSESSACVFTEQPRRSGAAEAAGPRESTAELGRGPTDPVHILPETLVSGAVHVASSAYSSALKVFDRIRNMHTTDCEEQERTENGVAIGSEVERCFSVLADMGFTDIPLNARLLTQHNYDMSRVIAELVQ